MRSIAREDNDALAIHERRISDLLTRLYNQSFKMFGRRLLNNIVKHWHANEYKNKDLSETLKRWHEGEMTKDVPVLQTPNFNLARQIWIRTQAALKVTQIAGTTQKQALEIVRQALDDSVSEGLSEIDTGRLIQARIAQDSGVLSRLRGRMIARTESHGSSNASTQMAAKSTRLPLKKEWIAALSERTRQTHMIANGQKVDIDQPFMVGLDLLMQPGDSSGSAGEIINCRCAAGYSL
jgi:uncharacterized protein with gpF-like domain